MGRAAWVGVVALVALAGCQTPPERLRVQPLPENGPATYADLLVRARLQATAATEAFYLDRWADLAESARNLEQTSALLPTADEIPDARKADLAARTAQLGRDAKALRTVSRAATRDVKQVNELLQRIHLKIRELHTPEPTAGAK